VKSEKTIHCSLYKTVETATNDAEEEGETQEGGG